MLVSAWGGPRTIRLSYDRIDCLRSACLRARTWAGSYRERQGEHRPQRILVIRMGNQVRVGQEPLCIVLSVGQTERHDHPEPVAAFQIPTRNQPIRDGKHPYQLGKGSNLTGSQFVLDAGDKPVDGLPEHLGVVRFTRVGQLGQSHH